MLNFCLIQKSPWFRRISVITLVSFDLEWEKNQPRPHPKGRGSQRPQMVGTSFMRAHSMRKSNEILRGDQTMSDMVNYTEKGSVKLQLLKQSFSYSYKKAEPDRMGHCRIQLASTVHLFLPQQND